MSLSSAAMARMDHIADRPGTRDLMGRMEVSGCGEIHLRSDTEHRLRAVVAIHSTRLGPAIGGCRFVSYADTREAINDAMRLARCMSYKSALFSLPYGGGKAVLIKPEAPFDREAVFESFGEFVESLGGRFLTAVDSGTSVSDMDTIARRTRFVMSTSVSHGGHGDPSPCTAIGVRRGIEAAVRFKFRRSDLEGLRVLIQGAGHVGYHLARELDAQGAQVHIYDTDERRMQRCVDEFGCEAVRSRELWRLRTDVFAPCALGGVIDAKLAAGLQTDIVAGAANNPLGRSREALTLQRRNVLYAPDFVINAGGLMHVVTRDRAAVERKIHGIHDMLMEIFERAALRREPPLWLAESIAERAIRSRSRNAMDPAPAAATQ